MLQPELEVELGSGALLTAVGRLRADAFDRIEPGHPPTVELSSLSRRGFAGDHVDYELRELVLETRVGRTHLTLGKQQVVWGQADGLKVLDLVDPQDFREFILDDFDESRVPLWTVNLERRVGPVDVQVLWVPDPSFHEIPGPDAVFAFTAPRFLPPRVPGFAPALAEVERPRRLLADSDAGVRVTSFLGGWDLGLSYLYQYDDRPVFEGERTVTALGPTVVFTPGYERTHVVGGTFSNAFGNLTVRGELLYRSDRFLSTEDPRETDAVVSMPELGAVLGFDWYGLEDTLLSLQVFQSWLLSDPAGLLRDRVDTTLTFLVRRELWNQRLRLEGIWIHGWNDADGLLRPKVSYQLANALWAWVGFDVFYGRSEGVFGEFDGRDRFVMGMQWGF